MMLFIRSDIILLSSEILYSLGVRQGIVVSGDTKVDLSVHDTISVSHATSVIDPSKI
jgi:hypothetical protein